MHMSDTLHLPAETRVKGSKGAIRALRLEGRVPAVIYGGKQAPEMIHVEAKELVRQLGTGHFFNSVIELTVDGKKLRTLPKDVAFHPVNDRPLHVDFLRIHAHDTVHVKVPVVVVGEDVAPGIKAGGVLMHVTHELELVVDAAKIPSEITVDVSKLGAGESIHLADIKLPKGAEVAHAGAVETLATITAPSVVGAEADAEAEAVAEADREASAAAEVAELKADLGDAE